jgi:hypothetical protein
MSRIEFTRNGITYSDTRDTPFGPSSSLTTISWKEWPGRKQPMELFVNDIGMESDSEGRIGKIWLEVSDFRLIGSTSSRSTTAMPLEPVAKTRTAAPENLSQATFKERAEHQLEKGEGQAVDILYQVKHNPGMAREEVCAAIGASRQSGSVGQYLVVLQMMGKIYSDKKGGKSRYFAASGV